MKKGIIFLMLTAVTVFAETVTVLPAADTYTIPTGGCFGTEDEILCANVSSAGHPDERMMIVWDLTEYSGREVDSALLNLNVFFQCPSGSGTMTQFFAATEEWDESWSGSHVSIESTVSGDYHFLGLGWCQVEINDLVQRWLSGEISNFGIVFKVNGVYPYTKCYSRETANSPYLELTLNENALEANTWAGIKRTWSLD